MNEDAIDGCAVRCVAELVAFERDVDKLPAAPTVRCWLALTAALERSPNPLERRRFLHKWNNAMTVAWSGWRR